MYFQEKILLTLVNTDDEPPNSVSMWVVRFVCVVNNLLLHQVLSTTFTQSCSVYLAKLSNLMFNMLLDSVWMPKSFSFVSVQALQFTVGHKPARLKYKITGSHKSLGETNPLTPLQIFKGLSNKLADTRSQYQSEIMAVLWSISLVFGQSPAEEF